MPSIQMSHLKCHAQVVQLYDLVASSTCALGRIDHEHPVLGQAIADYTCCIHEEESVLISRVAAWTTRTFSTYFASPRSYPANLPTL